MTLPSRWIKPAVSTAILLSFFLWMVWYVIGHVEEFKIILDVPWFNLLALYLIFLASIYLNGLYTRYILNAFDLNLGFSEWLPLSIATTAGNYLTFFRGGAGIRALYLKARHHFSFADFLSTLSAMYIMYFVINGLAGIIGMVLLTASGQAFDLPLSIFFLLITGISVLIMLADFHLPDTGLFAVNQIIRIVNGWHNIRRNKTLLKQMLINITLYLLLIILQTKIAFSTYGVSLSWEAALFYSAGKNLMALATITPGALGLVEAFTVYLGQSLHYTPAEALLIQGLTRFVVISTLLVAGPPAFAILSRRLRTPVSNDSPEPGQC